MISLLLLSLTVLLSAIVVRIGAIALELTGLPEEQASFQSLSAYTNTGFTTKEAEFILAHPQRRKIVKAMIVLGSAGIITTFAALGGTLISGGDLMDSMMARPTSWFPFSGTQIVLIGAVLLFYFIFRATHRPSISRLIKEVISMVLLKSRFVKRASFEEVLVNPSGYGVFQVEVTPQNPLAGKTIREARLRELDVTILYINRLSESINEPDEDFLIQEGDIAALFGPVTAISDRCCDMQIVEKNKEGKDEPLELGAKAPDFFLKDQSGREVRLSDYRGRKNLVMVFYPKDKSFFCTSQLKNFSSALPELRKLEAEVVAVNQESALSHAGFCDASGLQFSLLADPKKEVCRAYRALMFGGLLVDRTVYVLDKQGIIRYAKRGNPPVSEILSALKQINPG